ncbi:hypothetical protein F5J12DRAFT_803519 [Pisolithus orientalis]|uniref:uncharacterized protein n=1 Tax=Pisolithus orientalis TaxID=936130 RepID=UPI002224E82B|nr:uncharacterized protein F5J12DRAFT_803519 [Pisolithus orientalis]KAI6030871.1 hypothetical protein F5J12DRAFT_803519 [Pisolithus orientalis]
MEKIDMQESTSITFEWVLRGLKSLFDSSKGESKSKVTKSGKFGGGRWQILFYANSGTENGAFVSLYLSCEPNAEEKDKALDGKWVREGVYKFTFELRNVGKTVLFNAKEAQNHSFSSKTANWGWAQFAKRDHIYYNSHSVKEADALLIVCTITSSPQAPVPSPSVPVQLVPKDYLERVGGLLDDPLYSDVEFILPRRGRSKEVRRIYANRRILERADYFESMFRSGFLEASADDDLRQSQIDTEDMDIASDVTYSYQYNDSDDEDEDFVTDFSEEPSFDGSTETETEYVSGSPTSTRVPSVLESVADSNTYGSVRSSDAAPAEEDPNVQAKASDPSSPKSTDASLRCVPEQAQPATRPETVEVQGPKKMRVVTKDVAYATYKAVLYYLYTDVIVFAPFSSSFIAFPLQQKRGATTSAQGASESQSSLVDNQKVPVHVENPTTRREWIKRWQQNHPTQPAPCSAKAVYRLADKLGLLELKERASQHIQKSLSVENIPYEVFSPFSATFPDIRKVQVKYFLEHWAEVRASEGMQMVWQQIRKGRHPGFEEIWPVIVQNLEFIPHSGTVAEATDN